MVHNDGDIVRGLGFVCMYSAWVEEDVDDILHLLSPFHELQEKTQRWPISKKLEHAAQIVERLQSRELNALPKILREGLELFEARNEVVHGRIYAVLSKANFVQSGRKNVPTRVITSTELYNLANNFANYRGHLIGPQVFKLPKAIATVLSAFLPIAKCKIEFPK